MRAAIYSVGKYAAKRPSDIVTRDGCQYVKQSVVAFEGSVIVEGEADYFFGGDESKPYRSRVMVNPTWKRLLGALESQIKKTLDRHHVFLENARVVREEEVGGKKVKIVRLSLGS